ncbi:hypothetical protein BB561_000890 [Smittium simulii]|uniref:Uncharacterized protein n=1 Tax=Smittium simulii TaxID=133385 RepID=A0A2T9YX23_9FUNG|nr:hypothetical protein BB561_000890 [Smittium simulii]
MPTRLKAMVIKAIIQAVTTYGDEFFGIPTKICKRFQKVVDSATRVLEKCRKYTEMYRLRQELVWLTLIKYPFSKSSCFWIMGQLKTWISNLIKCPTNIDVIYGYLDAQNGQKKNNKSQKSKWIAATEAGTSCNWMGLELHEVMQSLDLLKKYLLKNVYYAETIEHMLLECSRWQALRADILAQYINIYGEQVIPHSKSKINRYQMLKAMVIKAIIQAVTTYGDEFFGIPTKICKRFQKVVDSATRVLEKCRKYTEMYRLRQELVWLTLIKYPFSKSSCFWIMGQLKTWISNLIKCPTNIDVIYGYLDAQNGQKKNNKSQKSKWIAATEAGTSCNWMGLELHEVMQSLDLLKKYLLKNVYYAETIEHMLLECSRWQALRADILAQYINIYGEQVATKPPLLPASISMRLFGKLLG